MVANGRPGRVGIGDELPCSVRRRPRVRSRASSVAASSRAATAISACPSAPSALGRFCSDRLAIGFQVALLSSTSCRLNARYGPTHVRHEISRRTGDRRPTSGSPPSDAGSLHVIISTAAASARFRAATVDVPTGCYLTQRHWNRAAKLGSTPGPRSCSAHGHERASGDRLGSLRTIGTPMSPPRGSARRSACGPGTGLAMSDARPRPRRARTGRSRGRRTGTRSGSCSRPARASRMLSF